MSNIHVLNLAGPRPDDAIALAVTWAYLDRPIPEWVSPSGKVTDVACLDCLVEFSDSVYGDSLSAHWVQPGETYDGCAFCDAEEVKS